MAQSRFKATLIWLHKWIGVVLVLFFTMWFASGIVLYFVPFPALTETERLAELPVIEAGSDCCLNAEEAARLAGLQIGAARLGMHADSPVWRVLTTSRDTSSRQSDHWQMLDARTGALLPAMDAAQAAAVAEAFSERHAYAVEPVERDQWTVPQGLDPYRPLYKVSMGAGAQGDDGLELYVSAQAAEVVRDTRRAERFWNWLGAVPHWIYPTVLRQFPRAWHHVVVWLSVPGVVLAVSGLALGAWQLFLNRSRWIPYRKFWMRWHHILGLAAAVFTLTWIFSGLLSMNPFGVFSPGRPNNAELQNWHGTIKGPTLPVRDALQLTKRDGDNVREVRLISVDGESWYLMRSANHQRLVHADRRLLPVSFERLPDELIIGALVRLRDSEPTQLDYLQAYDSQYYSRYPLSPDNRWQRPLPVWRAAWEDGTTIYADPGSGRLLLRVDDSGRWQRILYHGLHSLDFSILMQRPRLRDALVIGLSLLGLVMCVTACVLAWRSVFPNKRRRTPARDDD
ncbi:PepSY domain-containing protein [Bordetella tumulicola]|uniref:PepSY domain-containing protein n=1 Tax=Bordetella tumulicola TaxID=1649133 RepID=UPI0039EF0BDD